MKEDNEGLTHTKTKRAIKTMMYKLNKKNKLKC